MIEAWQLVAGSESFEPITLDRALAAAREPSEGHVVWLDVVDASDDDLQILDRAFGFGEFLLEDLREGRADAGQRTKLLPHGNCFHAAVRDCSAVGHDLVERELDLVFSRGWLCSVRHTPDAPDPDPDPFPMAEIQHRLLVQGRHEPVLDEGMVLWAFLDAVVDRYQAVTDAIDEHLDTAETLLLDDGPRAATTSPRELFDVGRLLTQFRHELIPLREVVGALLRGEALEVASPAMSHLRDVYDHLIGITELVESQRDVLAGLRDVHLSVVSNNMNRSMQQLAAWGAILIVATLVTGILGMNFRNQPDIGWEAGFLVVLGVIVVLALPLWWLFRRKGWL